MFKRIKEFLHKIWESGRINLRDNTIPRAAPSVEEAILPFDPEDYTIHPHELKYMIDSGRNFVLLDVRDEWEYELVHIEGAVSIPLGELPRRFRELSPVDEIIVYCHHGMRSLDAACLLQQLGFKSVLSIVGGIDRWASEIDHDLQRY
ncbi:MAG: rhodanese-like domain-containing protein [Candidatus Poribacteria bacterium]|nr:rhodanese-like domain-containing protein [Candidatus Poribacteria bacterium]